MSDAWQNKPPYHLLLSPFLPFLNGSPAVLWSRMSFVGWNVTVEATKKVITITYKRKICGSMTAMDGPGREQHRAEHHFFHFQDFVSLHHVPFS